MCVGDMMVHREQLTYLVQQMPLTAGVINFKRMSEKVYRLKVSLHILLPLPASDLIKMSTCDSVKDRQKTCFIFRSNRLSGFHSKAHGASVNPDIAIGK